MLGPVSCTLAPLLGSSLLPSFPDRPLEKGTLGLLESSGFSSLGPVSVRMGVVVSC